MAEAPSGATYEELLATHVYDRLRLRRTDLPRGFHLPGPRIFGYGVDPIEDVTECCAMAWLGAAGGIYSTPAELGKFTRGVVGGKLYRGVARAEQFTFLKGGASQPAGPGKMAAGLALFRYKTPCGTVFGHTGNFIGYTQFTAATRNGKRSVTVTANTQLNPEVNPKAFRPLARVYERAVCALLG